MATPCLGYPSLTAACEALDAQGKSLREISALVGRPAKSVSSLLNHAARRSPQTHVSVPRALLDRIKAEAQRRKTQPSALAARILTTVIDDDLIGAVLDDG